jgi:hypothetical protein
MFKLSLLDGEPETFHYGLVITAYTIINGKSETVDHATSKQEAKDKCDAYAAKYPNSTFHIV